MAMAMAMGSAALALDVPWCRVDVIWCRVDVHWWSMIGRVRVDQAVHPSARLGPRVPGPATVPGAPARPSNDVASAASDTKRSCAAAEPSSAVTPSSPCS
jgi:hypothetical protein